MIGDPADAMPHVVIVISCCFTQCCSHTLADLALQVAEAILDKAVPKRARGEGAPRSAPGETPLPTKFYRAGGGSAGM